MAITILKRWTVPVGAIKNADSAAGTSIFTLPDTTTVTTTNSKFAVHPTTGNLYCEYILISKDTETGFNVKYDLNAPLFTTVYPVAVNSNIKVAGGASLGTTERIASGQTLRIIINAATKEVQLTTQYNSNTKLLIEVWGF